MTSEFEGEQLVRRGTPTYRRALGALFVIGVATYALTYAPQPLLRVIGNEYGVSASRSALVMSATTFALAFFVLIWGTLSTRISERLIIIGGLGGAVIISLFVPFSPSWITVIVLRAVQGIVLAGPLTATLAWVGRHIETTSVTRVSGFYIAGTTVGGLVGRLLSGFVNELVNDWRLAIAAVSVLAVILGGIAQLLLPQAHGPKHTRRRLPRPDSRWRRRQRLISYAFAFVGMGMFVGIFNVLVYRVAEPPWNLGTSVTSMLFLSYLAGTVTSARVGSFVHRYGHRQVMIGGTILMAAGIALTLPTSLDTLWLGLFLLCAGFFAIHALNSGRASSLHPRPGTGSGLYLMHYYVGSSMGGMIFGFGWDIGRWPMVLAMAVISLTVIMMLSLIISDAEPAIADARME